MRLSVRFLIVSITFGLLTTVTLPGTIAHAQDSSQSSSQTGSQATSQEPASPVYVSIDPLSGVRYDNRFDVSVGLAYDHMKAGPTLLQGSNLGGLNVSGSYWFARRIGVEGSFRPYVGTSGAAPNAFSINGPFVAQYLFVGGPEFLGPHNKHGDLMAHVLVGGAYGDFEKDLRGNPPSVVDFYHNQTALAMVAGGHMDLNRSAHWVFRITPDAVITHYGINYPPKDHYWDVNFALSVGVEYKFKKKR